MAERSKELLKFEHNGTPLSSLESTLLVCDNKKESDSQTRRLPPDGMLLTAPLPPSQLLGKVKDFLGVMSEANKRLELDAKDLMLGVADLHTQEAVAAAESAISTCQSVIPLAADGSETDSEESSTDNDSDDDINNSDDYLDDGNNSEKPSSLVQKSISSKDNIHGKTKGNGHSKKRPRIVELS
ncbi:hypothetical protein GLYMA_10G254400v4 [Glycine max]|uniref:Uncharacterized protein n=2 Tax=Glycine max TaxID=3847 RepID=I1LEB1_SOYBN|nr:uncharacterized protein LOC100792110 isoform X2 [Glycine max]KRH35623.1 hypothetical protein GLYMA_10G254400v4 [Glycine max]|eukprot:XP_014618871.1 uncharacterized protein LOC100792110 isoform X2 [Glycine max]